MKKQLIKITFIISLFLLGGLLYQTDVKATVRDYEIWDGETPEEYEDYFDEEEEYIDEEDLYFPGDTGKITAVGSWGEIVYKAEYTSTDDSVVSVDANGNYKVLKEGFAAVNVIAWNEYGEIIVEGGHAFLIGGDMSAASLGKSTVQGYLFSQDYNSYRTDDMIVPLVNAPELKHCSFAMTKSTNSNMWLDYHLDKEKKAIVINASGIGKATLTFRINGKEFTVQVVVKTVSIKKDSALLAKKGKVQLKLKGYVGKVKWISQNKKVVTVSQKGLVKAKKKTGNTIVYAQIGDHRLGCAISVVSPQLKKIVNRAKKIKKTCTYSQPLRMNSKYYDCSSLVWKSFRLMGKTFGNKNYAPVAADLAKWCAQKKKMVKGGASPKNISRMKLRPGDIVFLEGSNNGRYKGIYHVEMFVGYRCYGFQGKTPVIGTSWATRYDGYGYGLRLVGRP